MLSTKKLISLLLYKHKQILVFRNSYLQRNAKIITNRVFLQLWNTQNYIKPVLYLLLQ